MATRAVGDTSQRELSYRKRLIEIANMINSAPSIQEILVDIKAPQCRPPFGQQRES